MRRITNTTKSAALALLLFGLIGASGCVEQEPSLVLLGNVPAVGEVDADSGAIGGCAYEATLTNETPLYTTGQVNLAALKSGAQPGDGSSGRATFVFGANLTNGLTSNGTDGSGLKTNTNNIIIKSAKVAFQFSSGTLENERFLSMIIPAEGGTATVGLPLINGDSDIAQIETLLGSDLSAAGAPGTSTVTVIAKIQFFGETFSGTNIESNTFEYPITFCTDCDLGVTPSCVSSK